MITPTTPLFTLTVAEFQAILASQPISVAQEKKYVYSLQALGQILGCGLSKIYALKRSGLFDPAIRQNGRKLIIDVDMARDLFGSVQGGRK